MNVKSTGVRLRPQARLDLKWLNTDMKVSYKFLGISCLVCCDTLIEKKYVENGVIVSYSFDLL